MMRLARSLFCLALLAAACTAQRASSGPVDSPHWLPTAALAPTSSPTASASPSPSPALALAAGDWARGPESAPATLVVYVDFQSPACAELAPTLTALLEAHPQDLRLIYRPFPLLTTHDKASRAGQAAEAAGAQGAFWEMHDLLFARWSEWVDLPADLFAPWLVTAAGDLDLDVEAFRRDLTSGRYAPLMEQAFDQGYRDGIPGAPVLYLNGALFLMGPTLPNLEAAVRLDLLSRRQYAAFPSMELDPSLTYRAHLSLSSGEVVLELFADRAPLAVTSFIFLARQGWYDGVPFHRVTPGVLVESGDPSGTGLGGPGYVFDTETDPDLTFSQAGLVGMSSSGPGVCGSQFFIALAPLPELDGSRTIFGRVIEGLELLRALEARDPLADLIVPPQESIRRVTIEER